MAHVIVNAIRESWGSPTTRRFWGRFLKEFRHLLFSLLMQLFPLICCALIEVRLRIRAKVADLQEIPFWVDESFLTVPTEELEASHKIELDRRAGLQAKAQANLSTATLASSFGLGVIGLLPKQPDLNNQIYSLLPFVISSVVSFAYLTSSAVCANRAARVAQLFDLYLGEALQTGTYGFPTREDNRKAQYVVMIKKNQQETLIVGNYTSASGAAMRNGVAGLAVALILYVALRIIPNL